MNLILFERAIFRFYRSHLSVLFAFLSERPSKPTRLVSMPMIWAAAILLPSWFGAPSLRAAYSYESVIDDSGALTNFFEAPSINSSGEVAFQGQYDGSDQGIFKVSKGRLIEIARGDRSFFTSFGQGGHTPINASGRVGFMGNLTTSTSGIFTGTGDGAPLTKIVVGKEISALFPITLPLAMNEAGHVAFTARQHGVYSIYIGDGEGLRPVISTDQSEFDLLGEIVAINSADLVAFSGFVRGGGGNGVYVATSASHSPVALSTGIFANFSSPYLSINSSGMVAFGATLDGAVVGGVWRGTPTEVAPVAVGSPYASFKRVAINASGQVAFYAGLQTSAYGIYTGSNAITDKVIQLGDTLFGAVLEDVVFGENGLNDLGQVSFAYRLRNGRYGVAVATPLGIRIVSIREITNDSVELNVQGLPGAVHRVLAADRVNGSYNSVGTVNAGVDGKFQFVHTGGGGLPGRYYRVESP